MRLATLSLTCLIACNPIADDGADAEAKAPVSPCGAQEFQGLIGSDESELARTTISTPNRIIKPGMAVTMDYREDRLNIEMDEGGIITRIYCG